MKKLNILVTGCGGDLGISIAKICKESGIFGKVIGTNNHNKHPGSLVYDKCYLVNNIDTPQYIEQVNKISVDNEIDIIVPVSELELRRISASPNFITNYFNKPILCANAEALNIGLDKFKTVEFLKNNNLPYPKTETFDEHVTLKFPYLVKPISGYGSKAIHIIYDKIDFNYYSLKLKNYIAQELIDVHDSEYTCGLFKSKSGIIRTIIIKRQLSDGTTSYGEIVENKTVDNLLYVIANRLNLVGSINVQLRILNNIPYVFEINPRFSSTVRFRHLVDYKDFVWSVMDLFDGDIGAYKPIEEKVSLIKVANEIIKKNEN
ncbi:MAG: ATP-grasp domain-containing protein [Mucilaginibacter sp.]